MITFKSCCLLTWKSHEIRKHALLLLSKVAGSYCLVGLSDETKKDSHTMFLDKSSTCRALSWQIRLGNSCISNMSKDNKEGETSKKNQAVFTRYWSLVEPQMVQSFEVATAALSHRTYLRIVILVFLFWMWFTVLPVKPENAYFLLIN